jgi:hypothetical protein
MVGRSRTAAALVAGAVSALMQVVLGLQLNHWRLCWMMVAGATCGRRDGVERAHGGRGQVACRAIAGWRSRKLVLRAGG